MTDREHPIQVSIVRFLDVALPVDATYFAVPNGGHLAAKTDKRGKRFSFAAIKLIREGLKKGVSDLLVIDPSPCGSYSRVVGLEVKTEDGRQSADQKDWDRTLKAAGGRYYVVRSMEDAAAALVDAGVKLRAIPSTAPGRIYQTVS